MVINWYVKNILLYFYLFALLTQFILYTTIVEKCKKLEAFKKDENEFFYC